MAKVSIKTYYHAALDLHKSGKLREARRLYADILKVKPNHLESLFMIGQSWYQENKFDEALSYFNQGLKYRTGNIDFLLQKGKTLIKLNRFDEAKVLFDQLINSNKDNPQILFHSARNLKKIGQLEAAIELYERLLQIDTSHIQALNNLGNLYQQVYEYDKSLACYNKLIELDNHGVMAYCNKAGLFQKMGKLDEAGFYYQQALDLDAANALAMYNLGVISNRRHNQEEALQWIQRSIKHSPENHKYLSTYATTLWSLGKQEEAIEILQKLIKSGTKSEEPYLRLARIFISNQENNRAIEILEPYVIDNSYCYEGMYLLGVLYDLKQELEKAEEYLTMVAGHPEFTLKANMALQIIYSKLGRMDKYDEMMSRVTNLLHQFVYSDRLEDEIPIYNLAYYPFDYELITAATKKFSDSLIRSVCPLRDRLNFSYPSTADKIKIGYLSPYFKKHPAGALIQGVLRYHDKEKFEVYGYAINCGHDEINQEIRSIVDHYVELDNLKPAEAAQKINNDGIHILVSLAGYNYGMKSEISAVRPAPIQIVCMDCHETMQTDFYDYVLKDAVVLNEENRGYFNESIAYLPPSHFFNTELTPSDKMVSRKDYGLPEGAFVFGCLNHPRKMSPLIIRCWVQILKRTSDTVLWLFHGGIQQFQENIYQVFAREGIDTDRIYFCGRESQKDHIRRMELIDLFLDTPFYNGHTTCMEALWMDIPVLTLRGKTVSSRLASSFLHALNLTRLICESEKSYVERAIELARDKTSIDELKHFLNSQKTENDFFNPKVFTEKLERAYKTMWEVHKSEKDPSDFTIN